MWEEVLLSGGLSWEGLRDGSLLSGNHTVGWGIGGARGGKLSGQTTGTAEGRALQFHPLELHIQTLRRAN